MRSHPVWTRRRFLGHLGAVGGSSLVMTAMTSWDLMAGQAGVRPVLSGRPSGAKVLILGAGVSGLVVGYELGKLGYDFRILEARDRVGGLTWTVRRGTEHTEIGGERQVCTFDEGQHVNVGAVAHPLHAHRRAELLQGARRPAADLPQRSRRLVLLLRGHAAGSLSNTRVRLREVKADLIGHTNELLVKAIDQRQLDLPLTAEDQQRLVSYLVAQGYLDSSDRALQGLRKSRTRRPVRASARCCNPASAAGCDRFRRATARQRRRCSIRSAAWTSSRRASSARSAATASPSTPKCSRCIRATRA